MKIGITIGDNDFQRTIEAFLRLFHDSRVSIDAEYCCHGELGECGRSHRGTQRAYHQGNESSCCGTVSKLVCTC